MVYIVVLNWNGWKDTIACLESLMLLNYENYKIVICDNKSTDGSLDKIKDWYKINKNNFPYLANADYQYIDTIDFNIYTSSNNKGLYLIQTGSNLGYAGGNNVGIKFCLKQTDMRYVWILNNDTEVTEDSLSRMVEKLQYNKNNGICGSRLVYHHDKTKIQALGGVFNSWLCTSKHYASGMRATETFDDDFVSQNIDYVVGASALVSKELLIDVGLMSEDYFLYYEEIDFALRAKQYGYSICVATDSIVYHKEGATIKKLSGLSDYYFLKNRLVLYKKFFKKKLVLSWLSLFVSLFRRIIRGNYSGSKAALFAILGVKWK